MTQRHGLAFSHAFAARGRALAEGRLAHLIELYDSGRWRRFFNEADFLVNVRDAKAALAAWCALEPGAVSMEIRPDPPPRPTGRIIPEPMVTSLRDESPLEDLFKDDVIGQGILADYLTERKQAQPVSRLPPIVL